MKVTSITIGADMKLSKKFQSAGGQASITADVDPEDNLDDVTRYLKAYARSESRNLAQRGMEDVEDMTK